MRKKISIIILWHQIFWHQRINSIFGKWARPGVFVTNAARLDQTELSHRQERALTGHFMILQQKTALLILIRSPANGIKTNFGDANCEVIHIFDYTVDWPKSRFDQGFSQVSNFVAIVTISVSWETQFLLRKISAETRKNLGWISFSIELRCINIFLTR